MRALPTPRQACGCDTRDGHVDPALDTDLMLGHGERSASCGDPLPHDVPGTTWFNGLYTQGPDTYCLCGHPNYMTCDANWTHGLLGHVVHAPELEVHR